MIQEKLIILNFQLFVLIKKVFLREERLNEAFQMLNKDKSGKITKDEIKNSLKLDNVDEDTLNELIKKFDLNGDGMIDYNEFLNMMNDG